MRIVARLASYFAAGVTSSAVFTAWMAYSGYALGLGYFYVAVASVSVWLARRMGAVDEDTGS